MNLFNKSNVVEEFSNELSKKEESWIRIMKILIYFKIIHFFQNFQIFSSKSFFDFFSIIEICFSTILFLDNPLGYDHISSKNSIFLVFDNLKFCVLVKDNSSMAKNIYSLFLTSFSDNILFFLQRIESFHFFKNTQLFSVYLHLFQENNALYWLITIFFRWQSSNENNTQFVLIV